MLKTINCNNFLKNYKNKALISCLVLLCAFTLTACGVYSFTGASISPDVKTVSIGLFKNEAPNRNPILSQIITERLKDKFLRETQLTLTNDIDADLKFTGIITGYATSPSSIAGGEQAARSRLTITVQVKYINEKDKEKNFEDNFSQFQDFDATRTLADVEAQLIDDISQKLVQDIFNKAVINW